MVEKLKRKIKCVLIYTFELGKDEQNLIYLLVPNEYFT
jgi:hypothetical protein